MENLTYTVVTLDRKENKNISLDTIKEWYSKRLLHEDSLVHSPETNQWQMLAKVFNLAEFPPRVDFRQSSNLTISNPTPVAQPFLSAQNQTPHQSYQPNDNQLNPYKPNYNTSQYYQTQKGLPAKSRVGLFIGIAVLLVFAVGAYLAVPLVFRVVSVVTAKKADSKFLAELAKIEIPGQDFTDPETGSKLSIPTGWRFIKPQNTILNVPDAKIMATDKLGNKSVMLEVVTVPSATVLPDNILDTGVVAIEELLKKSSKSYTPISANTIPFKNGLAKKIVYERITNLTPSSNESMSIFQNDTPIQGQIILTTQGNQIFVFQMWCPKTDYNNATSEFAQLENNLILPKAKTAF